MLYVWYYISPGKAHDLEVIGKFYQECHGWNLREENPIHVYIMLL